MGAALAEQLPQCRRSLNDPGFMCKYIGYSTAKLTGFGVEENHNETAGYFLKATGHVKTVDFKLLGIMGSRLVMVTDSVMAQRP